MIQDWIRRIWARAWARLRLGGPLPTLAGDTDIGRKRKVNEDCFALLPERRAMIVADGMGGHRAGDVASREAVTRMRILLAGAEARRAAGSEAALEHFLIHSLHSVNRHVMALAAANPQRRGMGCTFIVGLLRGRTLLTCHVGDVRAYLISKTSICRLTRDHTYAADYERQVRADPEAAKTLVRPAKNIVSRAMGFAFDEDPELHRAPMGPDDVALLCSDGLWNMVADEDMAAIVRQAPDLDTAAKRLVTAANKAGGLDNITVTLASLP